MNSRFATVIIFSIALAGCATPHVVQPTRIGDQNLTCNQLDLEMAEADRFRTEAQKEKGMTGTNVAAALFFWPAMIGTYSNSNEAIAAADARKTHLMSNYVQKNCSSQSAGPTPETARTSFKAAEERLENLKAMLEKGLISSQEYEERRKTIVNSL